MQRASLKYKLPYPKAIVIVTLVTGVRPLVTMVMTIPKA
jgi:hypothetical protein